MDERKRTAIDSVLQMALELANATQGAFLEANPTESLLRFSVVSVRQGTAESLKTVSERLIGETVAYGQGVTGLAAVTRKPQFSARSSGGDLSHVGGDGTPNAVLAVPVLEADRLLGVLTAVCFDRELKFSSDAVRPYALAATAVASILHESAEGVA